jgi:hypothetical protein
MEEAPENSKELLNSADASGMTVSFISIRNHYKNRSLWQRFTSFYDMGTRNWLIVSEISKEHSNFVFKNLEAGN